MPAANAQYNYKGTGQSAGVNAMYQELAKAAAIDSLGLSPGLYRPANPVGPQVKWMHPVGATYTVASSL